MELIKIFVASPGDVAEERSMVEAVAEELNRTLGPHLDLFLKVETASKDVIPNMGRPQQIINDSIGNYDIFVGLMWKRFGTPTGVADSGTEEEFRLAFDRWQKFSNPRIMFYFCERPYSPKREDLGQIRKVLDFKYEVAKAGLFQAYQEAHQFQDLLRQHLMGLLLSRVKQTSPAPTTNVGAATTLGEPQDSEGVADDRLKPGRPGGALEDPRAEPPSRNARAVTDLLKRTAGEALRRINGSMASFGLRPDEAKHLAQLLASGRFVNVDRSARSQRELEQALLQSFPRKADVYLPSFTLLDRPVTVQLFCGFCEHAAYRTRAEVENEPRTWRSVDPGAYADHPVTRVTYDDALMFCQWVKEILGYREVRLPSQMEYEYAVRGGSRDRLFPWGNTWEPNRCNDIFWGGTRTTSPFNQFPSGCSADRVWDLCGNVSEWLHDTAGDDTGIRTLASGSFRRVALWWGHASARGRAPSFTASEEIGFRIVVVE